MSESHSSPELDDASLHRLFSNLDAVDLATCACVCKAWRSVSIAENTWKEKVEDLEPYQLLREDVLTGRDLRAI